MPEMLRSFIDSSVIGAIMWPCEGLGTSDWSVKMEVMMAKKKKKKKHKKTKGEKKPAAAS